MGGGGGGSHLRGAPEHVEDDGGAFLALNSLQPWQGAAGRGLTCWQWPVGDSSRGTWRTPGAVRSLDADGTFLGAWGSALLAQRAGELV